MPRDKTLLDLDHTPTIDELKNFYQKNDWSAAQLTDPAERPEEQRTAINAVKRYLDKEFEQVTQEMGLKSGSAYYHQTDNPLMALRNNVEDLVSDGVARIINELETAAAILEQFDLNDDKKADELLHTAVETMLTVMDYEKMVKTLLEFSDERDFAETGSRNYRKMDHDRRWNHTDAKAEIVFVSEYPSDAKVVDVEQIVIQRETAREFIESLDGKDKRILKLYTEGYSQNEITECLGYSNNGSVSKRIRKMREKLIKMLDEKLRSRWDRICR